MRQSEVIVQMLCKEPYDLKELVLDKNEKSRAWTYVLKNDDLCKTSDEQFDIQIDLKVLKARSEKAKEAEPQMLL